MHGPTHRLARLGLTALLCALPLLVSACCGRSLREGEPLHDALDARRYLALPLSGAPDRGRPNVFASGAVIPAGAPIRIEAIAWLEPGHRIRFTGPDACRPHCTVRLRPAGDDDDPQAAFDALFVRTDPLAGLDDAARAHVGAHRVAAGMRGRLVHLALGVPDRVETTDHLGSPAERWIYERDPLPDLVLLLAADRVVAYEGVSGGPVPPHDRAPEG